MGTEFLFALALTEVHEISQKDRQQALDKLQVGIRAISDCILEITSADEHDKLMYYIYQTCKQENTRAERMQYETMLEHSIYGADYDD